MFTKQFASADEYENWLRGVGERISVLSITNQPGNRAYKPRQLWIRNPRMPVEISPGQQTGGAITVKYQTTDRTLAPAKSLNAIQIPVPIQIALGAAAFFALFVLAIREF
jgi:hypothetical protein